MKRFKLGTEYGSVIGHLKLLTQRLDKVNRICIDQTGVGEYFTEETRKDGTIQCAGSNAVLANEATDSRLREEGNAGGTTTHPVRLRTQAVGQVLLTISSSPPIMERRPKDRQISA